MSRCPCEHEQPARAFSAAAVSLVLIHDDLCQTTVTFIHRGGGAARPDRRYHTTPYIYIHVRSQTDCSQPNLAHAAKNRQKFICVQLPTSADNVTLLAVAAERRPCSDVSISPARRAHSSKPAAVACGGQMMGQSNGQTDTRPLHKPCCAYYASSVKR